ncbi:MAG TPA: hypothetical protein VJ927_01975 [Actinomycetota bacterium]|nr:hypothetical protein [Actinomycetota bacterium]
MEREERLRPKGEDEEQDRRPLISPGERQALRWMGLAVVLFFVAFIVAFVVANS